MLICISCKSNALLNNENILYFQNFVNELCQTGSIEIIGRELDNHSFIYVRNYTGEELVVDDFICQFMQHIPKLGIITKNSLNLDSFEYNINNSFIEKKSSSVLKFEQGVQLLRQRCPKKIITLVSFREYSRSVLLGNFYEGNAYVYSPDLDLDSLTADELYVFGFNYATKTEFSDWFYTGPLG